MYMKKLNLQFPWQSGTLQEEDSLHYTWSKVFYGSESGTLLKIGQKYLGRFEMWSWRRKENIIWNDRVRNKVLLRV
jgi:hypothetical protein